MRHEERLIEGREVRWSVVHVIKLHGVPDQKLSVLAKEEDATLVFCRQKVTHGIPVQN